MPSNKDRTRSRKTKASSPIDSDQTFKKQRDQQQSDSETTPKTQDFEMIELASTEQPDIQGRENYILPPHLFNDPVKAGNVQDGSVSGESSEEGTFDEA